MIKYIGTPENIFTCLWIDKIIKAAINLPLVSCSSIKFHNLIHSLFQGIFGEAMNREYFFFLILNSNNVSSARRRYDVLDEVNGRIIVSRVYMNHGPRSSPFLD